MSSLFTVITNSLHFSVEIESSDLATGENWSQDSDYCALVIWDGCYGCYHESLMLWWYDLSLNVVL